MKKIYTDGSCYPNPNGIGGWSFVYENKEGYPVVVSGAENNTTNNRMELKAILEAIKRNDNCIIYSDSEYSIKSIKLWMERWIKENQEDRKNIDLFREINEALKGKNITLEWVKGHNGNYLNEIADKSAGDARLELQEELIEREFTRNT